MKTREPIRPTALANVPARDRAARRPRPPSKSPAFTASGSADHGASRLPPKRAAKDCASPARLEAERETKNVVVRQRVVSRRHRGALANLLTVVLTVFVPIVDAGEAVAGRQKGVGVEVGWQ